MIINDFMLNILNQLQSKKDIAESTAITYLKNMFILNNKKPFTNLSFLKKYDTIQPILSTYAESTQRNIIASVLSILSLYKDKPTYKKVITHYTTLFNGKTEEHNKQPKNKKSKTQDENWLEWNDILEININLLETIKSFGKKHITPKQYNTVLQFFTISLFTHLPPRRNKDYQECYIVKEHTDKLSKDRNYLDLSKQEFIFNVYKTAKTYGVQTVSFSNNQPFMEALDIYLHYHPLYNKKIGSKRIPLLVNSFGEPLLAVNSITRILNKATGKHIGASMLRHIYLSSKYGDELKEMKGDADAMGHSVATQKEYIKIDTE